MLTKPETHDYDFLTESDRNVCVLCAASNEDSVDSAPEKRYELDCYPYTFSPLLLFAQDGYFDKGHSNYNSVAQFFESVLDVDMLENVLYDRKNMLYEELLDHVTTNRMLVTCCIDSHFTAFQVLSKDALVYYDPLKPHLAYISGTENYRRFVLFLLLKCSYGDSQHIQENKNYCTLATNPTSLAFGPCPRIGCLGHPRPPCSTPGTREVRLLTRRPVCMQTRVTTPLPSDGSSTICGRISTS